jgi:hypothetical protein
MKKVLLFVAIIATVLTGCSNNEELTGVEKLNGKPIDFRAVTNFGEETRATEVTSTTIGNFHVRAVYWDTDAQSKEFMKGVTVTRGVGGITYTYAPLAYMPTNMLATDYIGFHAYSPAGSQNVTTDLATLATTSGGASSGTLTYQVPVDASTAPQEDFVVASSDISGSTAASNGTVALTFKHALAKFKFAADNDSEASMLNVTAVKLYEFGNKAILTLPLTNSSWGTPSATGTYIMSIPQGGFNLVGNEDSAADSYTTFTTFNEGLMVLPQTLAVNADNGSFTDESLPYVGITYSIVDAGGNVIVPSEEHFYSLSTGGTFAINPQYEYTLRLKVAVGKTVDFSVTVGSWTAENVTL